MHSCMSKYRFVRVRSSFFVLKIISGIWRPLEADPGGQPGTDLEVSYNMLSCMSIYGFFRVRISILMSNITSSSCRLILEAIIFDIRIKILVLKNKTYMKANCVGSPNLYLAGLQDQPPVASIYNILVLTQELKS